MRYLDKEVFVVFVDCQGCQGLETNVILGPLFGLSLGLTVVDLGLVLGLTVVDLGLVLGLDFGRVRSGLGLM